jgi:hypothetical protein
MGAFLGISLWVALATVVPGLVTIALLYGALVAACPGILISPERLPSLPSDWLVAALAVTVMVLTQAFGILLERLIIHFQLFPFCKRLAVPADISPAGVDKIDAYDQYDRLYILLARLSEQDDSQGHLKRASAQFFLTNNTLMSFLAAIAFSLALMGSQLPCSGHLGAYVTALVALLLVSYWVAVIRFQVMAKSIWATDMERRR